MYLNALGLLLRVYVRGELDVFGNRLKVLADCVADQVSIPSIFFPLKNFSKLFLRKNLKSFQSQIL